MTVNTMNEGNDVRRMAAGVTKPVTLTRLEHACPLQAKLADAGHCELQYCGDMWFNYLYNSG